MGSPDERAFVVFPRGHVRDNIILASFRNDLRALVNPLTGLVFTEDEIARATAPGTRFYIEADSIDLYGQATQQRAAFFATQIDPRKANTEYLKKFHGALWLGEKSQLEATGASGPTRATGINGTVIPGSSNIPDAGAAVATDPNGLRYQNITTKTITNGFANVTLVGIDTGFVTRLPVNTELRWSLNVNPGTDPVVTVLETFDGGFDAESDEEYSARIVQRMRYRPASGNAVHFQAWAQEASAAVEQAFVYPAALNAGSVVVAMTEKRPALRTGAIPEGPLARLPSVGTLNAVAQYIVPPSSPVVPEGAFVLPVGVSSQSSDIVVRLALGKGRSGGWSDVEPWPSYSLSFPSLALASVSVDGLTLEVFTDKPLPGNVATLTGASAPKVMVWNEEISRFVQLDVASINDPSPGTFTPRLFSIVLNAEPELYDSDGSTRSLDTTDKISPYTDRATAIAESIERYFDSLGPGEAVDPASPRFVRAARQPNPSISFPQRAGQGMLRYVLAGLGGLSSDAELTSISRNEPDLPTNIVDGPNMVTLGRVNIFPM